MDDKRVSESLSYREHSDINNLIKIINKNDRKFERFIKDTKAEMELIKAQIENMNQIGSENREFDQSSFSSQSTELNLADKVQEIEDKAEVQTHTHLQTLEDLLYSEESDEDWSHTVNDSINEALIRPEMQGIELVKQHCGSTVCRVDLSFDKSNTDLEQIDEVISLIADRGQAFSTINEEDSNIILYFSSEGYLLL